MFANQQNAITNFEPIECIELSVLWEGAYKYCDKSIINKSAFLKLYASVNEENLSRGHNVILQIFLHFCSAGTYFFNDKTAGVLLEVEFCDFLLFFVLKYVLNLDFRVLNDWFLKITKLHRVDSIPMQMWKKCSLAWFRNDLPLESDEQLLCISLFYAYD